jgi:hypothetical protein
MLRVLIVDILVSIAGLTSSFNYELPASIFLLLNSESDLKRLW